MASKRSVNDFVKLMMAQPTPPVSFLLMRDQNDEEAQCANVPAGDLAVVQLEEAIGEELATVSGEVSFRLIAMLPGGAVLRRTLLTYIGRAPKDPTVRGTGFDVNRELVGMVAESNRLTMMHAKELFGMSQAAHRETREALVATQAHVNELALALADARATAQQTPDVNQTVITQRLDSMIDMGTRLLAGKVLGSGAPPVKPGIPGRHAAIREFVDALTDDEIDRLRDTILSSGIGEALIDCLGVSAKGRLLTLFQTQTEGT